MNEGLQTSIASALSEQQQRIAAQEKLKGDAALYGYEISPNVPYDGNCFFTAVAQATGISSGKTLRQDLTSYLQKSYISYLITN